MTKVSDLRAKWMDDPEFRRAHEETGPHRSFRVDWSDGDMTWVGLCDQYPSLSWLAATEAEAMVGIMLLVGSVESDDHARQMLLAREIMARDRDILSDTRMDDDYIPTT